MGFAVLAAARTGAEAGAKENPEDAELNVNPVDAVPAAVVSAAVLVVAALNNPCKCVGGGREISYPALSSTATALRIACRSLALFTDKSLFKAAWSRCLSATPSI